MPPLPNSLNTIKVRLAGIYNVAPWNCIFYVQYTGPAPTAAELATFATAIGNTYATNLLSIMSTNVQLQQVFVIDLSSNTSPSAEVQVNHIGTRVGTSFTAQVACVSSWTIARRYRGGHPRNYWPAGVTADSVDHRQWEGTARAAFQAAFEAFRVAINGLTVGTASVVMSSVSYRTAHALRPTPVVSPISAAVVHPRIDTQRRRLGKEAA